MVTMPGSQRTLADSWGEVVTREGFNAVQGGKKHSQLTGYTPTKKALRKPRGALKRRWSTRENAVRKYEASVAKMVAREEAPIRVQPVPDMDSWALIHGVVDFSETTKSRGFGINEGGGTKRYVNSAPVSAATPRGEDYAKAHRSAASFTRRRGCAFPTVEKQSCPVPEVEALEGFLSDMQNRLSFLEEEAVRTGPAPTSALSKRNHPSAGMDTTALFGPVEVFDIPERLMENVEEARRRWTGHRDNLEMRDKDFLDGFRRIARMASSQILIARIWRGHRILKKYSMWKRRRQRKCKIHLCAWLKVVKANMLYARHLKRFGFGNWNDMAQEDRNTRDVGIRAVEATVMRPRLTRQAVVRFFEEGGHLTDGLSLEEASNRASMKRKISKILFESWRDEVHAYQRSVARGAFRISKAARLQTVSTILWAPEWVSLLFHMWSRMVKFSRAVREGTKIPTFPVEEGNESFPEWDSWVTDRGRRMLLKREALQRGGKIFLHNKFRRWAAFARWYMAQEERVKDATQHYDHYKMNQVFNAWAKMARERGSMMRRVSRYWAGWRYVSNRRQRTKTLKNNVEKHVRLLRIGAVMEEMKAITRDRKIMAAFAVSKLLLTQALIGGNMLSYAVTGQSAHFVALLAWQAWKSFVAKRRRWKWLLYQHSKTESLHAKQAILRAWSFITRRHRPDDLSPTLSASLPFSTWDRFIRSYVDRGIIPRNQLHKDMVSRGVMQQNNTWWLVNRNIGDDSRGSRSAGSRGCSADGTARGYVESQSCGSSAWGRGQARKRLDQFVNSTRSKEKVASVTDWRTLGPALFKAIDECDTKGVSNLLRRGAQVNAIHVPLDDTADSLRKRKGRVQGLFANTDERTGDVTGGTSALGYNLDLQAPTLVPLSDGTFEVRGSTPLHLAACRLSADFLPIVILLLHAGAWVDALDSAGKTPQQLCTSPQIAALLHKHRERLHAFKFSSRELCWGQEVLTSEGTEVGGEALWRYITRVAILSKIEELHAILRLENKRAEDTQTESQSRPSSGATTGKSFGKSQVKGSECITEMGSLDVDPEEREKELIRMRIERLEGARAIVEREHALHGRRLMTDGGGGGRGGEEMDMLFDELDQTTMEREESTPSTKATRNRRTSESPDDDDIGICSGKGHTLDEIRKAFLCRRMEAANWFQRFGDTLLRADLLGIPERSKRLKRSRAGCSEEDTDSLLAVLEGSARGVDVAASAAVEKCEWSVCGSIPSKPALAGLRCRKMSSSGTDAFNLMEANDCWEALETVLDRRRKVVSDRCARDRGLIERGTWGDLQRVIVTDQEANEECAANPPRVWTRHEVCWKSPVMNPRQADGREMEPILPSTSFDYSMIKAAEANRTEEGNIGVVQTERKEAGVLERLEERQLVIHVIPTSASQRCHWASVAIRGTCEHQVLAGTLRTFETWRTGNENGKASRSEKEEGNAFCEKGVLSRIPKAWWGNDGERVLDLMLQERQKLFRKRERLTLHARELEFRLASVAETLQELKNRENEIGTTVRKVATETRKSEMKFRQDMERWHEIMQKANTKVGSISRKRAIVTDETAALEDTLANWDSREKPTAAERSMRKKNDEEEITRETLQRDIEDKRELVSKLDVVEKQSKKSIEIATQKLKEGRVFLAQVQVILAKYSSYSMKKMETLEEELKLCSKQKEYAMDVQALVAMQLQAESRRLEELEKGIGILQEAGVVVPQTARSSNSANNFGRSNDISFPRQCEEAINGNVTDRAAAHWKDGSRRQDEDAGCYPVLDGDDAEKLLGHVDGTATAPYDGALSPESARVGSNSSTDGCVSSLDLLKNGEISGSSSREGKESAVVSLLCLIHENATKLQADSQPFYRWISQREKEKPLRLKSPVDNSLLASQIPEKNVQEGSPHELPLVTQTCEASSLSNVHSCREDGVRMNEGSLPFEEACGVMEEGQPSEVGEKAAPDSTEAHMEAQEEERRERWEEEDEDEQAAWLAMRGGDETFEEELELTKEEISRLLQGQYRDALEHIFEPERQAALALKEDSAAVRGLSASEERDQEDQTTIGDEDTSIAHLLGNSDLELTQEERETLFDLDGDEWGEIDGPDMDNGDEKLMLSREGRIRRRSRDPTSGILLFLRRCGQRRTPEDPPENPNAYGLLGNPPGHTPIVKPHLDSYISLNFIGRKGDTGQELVTMDAEQEREVEDATNNVPQDYEKGGKLQSESSENDEVGIIWRESSSRQKRGQNSMLSGRDGQGDVIDDRRLNLLYRRLGSSIDDSIENDAKARSFDKTLFKEKSIPASPDQLERMDHLHAGQEVAISDAVVSSECMPENLGKIGLTVSTNNGQSITDNRKEQASFMDAVESSLLSSVGATSNNGSKVTTCTEVDNAQASLLVTRKIAGEVLEEEEDGDERMEKSYVASSTLEEESMVVERNKMQPWSAEERVSPTRREMEKESLAGDSGWQRWPLSRPCNSDNRAENPSIVFDPRPPWLQPMDSVFAPRVSGSALKGYPSTERGPPQHQQSKTGSAGRGIDAGAGVEKNSKNGLLLRGGSSLLRLHSESRTAPQSSHSYATRRETGRRVGEGTEGRDSVTSLEDEAILSAQTLHRRRSASTAVLRVEKEAPNTEDDVWTWGWHEDASQDLLQESTGILIPGVASEASTHANRAMLRRASPKRSREQMYLSHGNPVDTTSSGGCHRTKHKDAKTSNARNMRPWTTGEFQDGEDERIERSSNRAVTAEGKIYLRAGVTQINPSEVKARGELALDYDTSIHCKADAENEDVVDSLSSQKGRRVSFADEAHGTLGLEPTVFSKEVSRASEQTLSSVIFSSYHKGKNETKSRSKRRPTIEERRRYEAEILLAARELLFSDTRPDGLRPITGCPMENGRITVAPGGLYVGLAGLRSFELPLVGVASNRDESGHLKVLRSQPLACVGSTGVSSKQSGGEPTPFTHALTASNDGPSRLVTGSLPKRESEDQTETRGAWKIGDTEESLKATEVLSVFAQKPAVLWSAATLSADDLVSSSPYDRKTRPLTAKDYTSKALLAAYKRMHPVFKVEASSWHAIPELDYVAPPARWGNPESVLPPADREKVWKCFKALPISRAEANALREVVMSRSGDQRPFGRKGRTIQAGESLLRQITATRHMGSDSDASCSFSSQTGSDTTPLSDMEITGDILSIDPVPLQEEKQSARNLSENVKPSAGDSQERREPTSASEVLPLQKSHDKSRFIRTDKAEKTGFVTKENLGTERSFEEESRHQKWGMEAKTSTAASSQMISRHSGVIATEKVLSAAHRGFPGDPTLIPAAENVLASSIVSTSRGPRYLRSEVDVDNALRTMMRLSNSDGESYEAHLSSIQQFCPTFITDMRERLWRRERELSLAPTTRGVKQGVLSRGGTRSTNGTHRDDTQATSAQQLTLEGQKLGSKKRVYQRLPRLCERRSSPQGRYVPGGDGGEWTESGNVQGRSAPGLGQRESSGGRITMEAMNSNLSSFKAIGNRPSTFTATTKSSRPPSCQHPELLNGSKYIFIDAKRCVGRGGPSSTSDIRGHMNNRRPYRSSRKPTAVPRDECLDEPIRDEKIAGVVDKDNTKVNWSMAVESTEHLGSSMALTTMACPIANGSTYDGMPMEPLDGNKKESKNSYQSRGSKKAHSLSEELLSTVSSGNMRTSVERQDNEGSRREKLRKVKSVGQIDGHSPTAVVLPRLTKGGAAMETTNAQERGDLQRQIFAAEVKDSRASKINKGGDRSGGNGKLPTVEHDPAHQQIRAGADGKKGEGDVGLKRILVHTRPQRVESKDLETTTEALTTHHLSIDELLQTDEEERPRSSGHGGYRVRHRKEPVVLTQAVRTKDMAYWKTEEAKEQERLYRKDSTAGTAVSEGSEASTSNCQHVGDANCSIELANRSEEEKDEVSHLLPIVRRRRLSRIAKVRAERRRQMQSAVQLHDKSVVTSTVSGDSSLTGSPSKTLRATKDESELALENSGAGASTAAVISVGNNAKNLGTEGIPGTRHRTETAFLGTRSKQEEKGVSPWKGFQTNEEEEAMLKRRQPRAQGKEPTTIKSVDEWERQLLVPEAEDNLVNFHLDSSAIQSKFGRLRRWVKIRDKTTVDEDAQDISDGGR